MKIPDRTTVRPGSQPGRTVANPETPTDAHAATGDDSGHAAPSRSRSVEDVATLLGVPTAEMTPAIRQGFARLIEDVVRLQTEIEAKDKRIAYLEKLVDEDPLMPVLNRRAFVRELSRTMALDERYGLVSSILYFDVDDMKRVNDGYGHAAGDAALAHVAETLRANVRKSDVVGRLGGDEFGVILIQADEPSALGKGQSLATLIAERPFSYRGEQLHIDVSFGASCFSRSVRTADEALAYADRHMYAAKRTRRDSASR